MKNHGNNWLDDNLGKAVRLPFLCAVVLAACFTAPAATRIALVSGGGNSEIQNVQDTALVQLGKDAGLEMVERAEINRVLQEQQLSLAGVVGANEAVKVGQLLHADLFAVLEGSMVAEGGSPPLALVVFDARTGVRYADSQLAGPNTGAMATALVTALRAAVAKSHQTPDQLRTVGLLLVRNVDLPRTEDGLCDATGLLLERELGASPNIAVLERRRLEHVTNGRKLGGLSESNQLLVSLETIELEVSRAGNGLTGTIALSRADGTRTNGITATVPAHNAADLAQALAVRLRAVLQAVPGRASDWDREAESGRFHREAQLLQQSQDYAAAVRALDAAWALAPTRMDYELELAKLLPDAAIELLDPGSQRVTRPLPQQPSAGELSAILALGHRDADLLLELCRTATASSGQSNLIPEAFNHAYRQQLDMLLSKLADVKSVDGNILPEITSLAQKDHVLQFEVLEPWYFDRAKDEVSFREYGREITGWMSAHQQVAPLNSQQWRDDTLALLRRWLLLSRKFNPREGGGDHAVMVQAAWTTKPARHGEGPAFAEFWKSLEADPDPLVRVYARLGEMDSSLRQSDYPNTSTLVKEQEFRRYACDLLDSPGAVGNEVLRNEVWTTIDDALVLILNDPMDRQEHLETCRFALAHHEIRPSIFRRTMFLAGVRRKPSAEDLEIVDSVLKLARERPESYPGYVPDPSKFTGQDKRNANRIASERETFIADFQRQHDEISADLAGIRPEPAPPWAKAVKLLDFSGLINGYGRLFQPVVKEGAVYVVAYGFPPVSPSQETLQLVRVSLAGDEPAFLGCIPVNGVMHAFGLNNLAEEKRLYFTNRTQQFGYARAACMGGGNYFLGTSTGLYIFPLNGGPVEHLCATNGLPTDQIFSLAYLDGRLYLGAAEVGRAGYLAVYDPASRSLNMLASSRRSEHRSPFDDRPPFCPVLLTSDDSRHRLVMIAGPYQRNDPLAGFWAVDAGTGAFTQLAGVDLTLFNFAVSPTIVGPGFWAGQMDAGTIGVLNFPYLLASFDIPGNQLVLDYDMRRGTNQPGDAPWNLPDLGGSGSQALPPPFLSHDGWLWSAHPFQRNSLDSRQIQAFPQLRADYKFEPGECLRMLDDGKHLLAADQFSLWLLNLADETGENEAKSSAKN